MRKLRQSSELRKRYAAEARQLRRVKLPRAHEGQLARARSRQPPLDVVELLVLERTSTASVQLQLQKRGQRRQR